MIEHIFKGGKRYWLPLGGLLLLFIAGLTAYLRQLEEGLSVTGLSQAVSWGLYIANFTFFVGVAASAVMLVLPYYLHDQKAFRKIVILGEFLAVAACIVAVSFVLVDLGQPARVFNMMLYPTPNSLLFWDMVVLSIYLLLNIVIGWVTLDAENKEVKPPSWIKPLIIISIPWAISIHTVTAFIYAGLAARPFWMTALMAPRFLASAFASGPALLILLALMLRKWGGFDTSRDSLEKVARIVAYGIIATVFCFLLEIFTVYYSQEPGAMSHFQYLLFGIDGNNALVPWMWLSVALSCLSIVLLVTPSLRQKQAVLAAACMAVFVAVWIDKGLGLVVPGFIPSTTGEIIQYAPTFNETLIVIGVWAMGALILTALYKIVLGTRRVIGGEGQADIQR
jgi:molybdopterin-containing oxidoreductase family membrane subunit